MRNMPIVDLIRLSEIGGTFGALLIQRDPVCWTLEPQDRENARNISSIPAQQYICNRVNSPRFGETFMIMDVPGRDSILFHPGNDEDDTEGCVILGMTILGLRLGLSREAFSRFMGEMVDHDRFHLTIREVY